MSTYEDILKKKVVGIVGSVSSGKTNTLIDILKYSLRYKAEKVVYFYHDDYKKQWKDKVKFINSLQELEQVKNSFIFVDEFLEFFKLNDRHSTELVKRVLFQIEHNNNILVLAGLPEYFRKFICSFVRCWLLHKLYYDELISGSSLKKYVKGISGDFVGGTMLNLEAGEFVWNGGVERSKYNPSTDKKHNNKDLFKVKANVYDNK